MLDYETLLHANFTELSQAVAKWSKLPAKFRKISTQYSNTVEKGLQGSDWDGEAAAAAVDKLKYVERQIDFAADEAEDVYKLFDDAYEAFHHAQTKLRTIKGDIDKDEYLAIRSNGEVYLDPPKDVPAAQLGMLNKSYRETIEAYRSNIQTHITAAQEADEALAWVLNQDHNGRKKGFDSNTYHSIADAKKGREKVLRDLKDLEPLTGKNSELALAGANDSLDPATLKRINTIFSRHEGDPYFAEKFATGTGAKGTLEIWTRITDRKQFGDDQTKLSAQIQKSLGYTLATASQSDSDAMERWKKDMITLGQKPVTYLDMSTSSTHEGPRGFQVMSSLMRHGEYDKGFLDKYGDKLISFERDSKEKPTDLWNHDVFLNFGSGSDQGLDPMAGYMEALGHNPEAAKERFYSDAWEGKDKLDSDLKYMLIGRDWPDGNPLARDKRGFGYDELGHALEAATLGAPYDRPDLGLHRDETTANIMSQVVHTVAQDQNFLDDKTGLGNSLAKMGAGYMDDLNWAVSNFTQGDDGQSLRDKAFHHDDSGKHIGLKHETASAFLANVGQHAGNYEILSAAQREYTVGALKSHAAPGDVLGTAMETGAKTHGILDQARVSEINRVYGEATDAANRKLAEAAEWKKFGVSQGIGLAAGLAVLPFGGPTASAAVAFAVPSLVEGIGGAIETNHSIAIDREMAKQEADFDHKEVMTKSEFVNAGRSRSGDPLEAYIAAHPEVEGTDWHTEMRRNIEMKYNAGDNETDQTDAD
ncbi:DUF6571 family protein [Streptomyces sp. NRRL S-920]|uniref:DUF6571 family protein n=1 Tax=Streptomyces sp. NRRL S-920 TaxID=1463921 RepID=UPI0004C4CDEA|nr:DUF6571 family protein [Streptomyces sp. NRRL S-920]